METQSNNLELTKKLRDFIRINEKIKSLQKELDLLWEKQKQLEEEFVPHLKTDRDIVIKYNDSFFAFAINKIAKDTFKVSSEVLYKPVELLLVDEDGDYYDSPANQLWNKLKKD